MFKRLSPALADKLIKADQVVEFRNTRYGETFQGRPLRRARFDIWIETAPGLVGLFSRDDLEAAIVDPAVAEALQILAEYLRSFDWGSVVVSDNTVAFEGLFDWAPTFAGGGCILSAELGGSASAGAGQAEIFDKIQALGVYFEPINGYKLAIYPD